MTTAGSEAAPSGGAVGWGLAEGSKFGTALWGGSFIAPHLASVFLETTQAHTRPPPQSTRSPAAPRPQPGGTAGGSAAHPPRPGSSWFLIPQQMDASTALASRLPPGLPSPSCSPTLPVLPAVPRPLPPGQHRASSPPAQVPGLPGPLCSPPLPRDPTLTHTDADQCVHDGGEGLHVLALSHGPSMPARPRAPDPGCGCEPQA